MIEQKIGDWQSEMKNRFKTKDEVAFVCPACGRIATIKNHVDAGGTEDGAPQQCVGRVNGKGDKHGKDQGFGCNWAAFGLFGTMGKGRKVIFPDNSKGVEVFDFAPEVLG